MDANERKNRYSSASKADVLSRALENVLVDKGQKSSRRGSSTMTQSVQPKPFLNSTVHAKTIRDIDSQADRYRNTIRQLEKLQMSSNFAKSFDKSMAIRSGQVYPTPIREGVFDRNKKSDGIKYADAKTQARKFELDKLSQDYNPNRFAHVSAADAIIDPYVTISHEMALPKKDPGYVKLSQQDLVTRDKVRRVINDYQGRPIVKVDQEGGIFDQQLGQGIHKQQSLTPHQKQMHDLSARNVRGRTEPRKNAFSTSDGAANANISSKFMDLQTALQTVQKGTGKNGALNVTDIDSTLSTRGLMQRKLYLMKMMLKNEKHANSLMKQKIGDMGRQMH